MTIPVDLSITSTTGATATTSRMIQFVRTAHVDHRRFQRKKERNTNDRAALYPDCGNHLVRHSGFAQSGQTAQIPLQFDFLNPGARSLALGSAFIAVADDATAAFTNPAGLTFLIRAEASAELRYRRLDTPFLSGGRLSGTVTNIGQDTIAGPSYSSSIDSAVRPYFISVVYPVGRFSIAAYRHELVLQSNDFLSNGAFEQALFAGTVVNNSRQFALSGSRKISIDNYGAGFGYRPNDVVSVGLTVAVYRFDATADFASFLQSGGGFGPLDPNAKLSTTTQRGSDTKAAVNAGVLLTVHPKVRVGAVFRQGTDLQFTQVNTVPRRRQ